MKGMHMKDFTEDGRISEIQQSFGNSSDIKTRSFQHPRFSFSGVLVYIDGIVDTSVIEKHILHPLLDERNRNRKTGDLDIEKALETAGVEVVAFSSCKEKLINGWTLILLKDRDQVIAADTAKWKERALTTPKGQRAVEGPDIGFNESRKSNVALVRSIVKNPMLRVETETYGSITQTSVSLVYIESKVDEAILKDVREKLSHVSMDYILDSNFISEYLTKESKSIFPLIINTERPDAAAAQIIGGRVCILVDGSPYALIAPAELVQFFHTSEDYYIQSRFNPLLRPLRILFFWLSLYIPALYVAFTTFHAGILPDNLLVGFVAQRQVVPLPTFLEVVIVNWLIDAIYEGSNRLPQSVVLTISIFGAIVFGQSAVEAQLIQPITLVVLSGSFILSSIVPTAALNYATRFLRLSLILISALLGLYGLALATLMLLIHLCSLKSFQVPYLSPIAPFTWKDQKDTIIREAMPELNPAEVKFPKEEDPSSKR